MSKITTDKKSKSRVHGVFGGSKITRDNNESTDL